MQQNEPRNLVEFARLGRGVARKRSKVVSFDVGNSRGIVHAGLVDNRVGLGFAAIVVEVCYSSPNMLLPTIATDFSETTSDWAPASVLWKNRDSFPSIVSWSNTT